MSHNVLSVTQINEYIRATLDADRLLSSVAIKGEISNYKLYPSGHHYFTLKDENASLKCVMFRSSAIRMRYALQNGMKVIVLGKISVYPRDGAYQLYCTSITPDGVGDLYVAFEQLKAKLSAEGLFDPAHKKPIPQYPNKICIITSSAGAAVHDMIRILSKRYPLCSIYLLPVRVQGSEAPGEIASAIAYANLHKLADVLIVGRGGGSIEDLWAFNDEIVARAIFASVIPVISAVGHEPDVTISDFVADLRAATPSNAAELAVPDQDALKQLLDTMFVRLCNAATGRISSGRQKLKTIAAAPVLQGATHYIEQRRSELKLIDAKLLSLLERISNVRRQQFISLVAKLNAMSPLSVLSRGYAIAQDTDDSVIKSVDQIKQGQTISVLLHDGRLDATVINVKENCHEQNPENI